MQWPDFSTMTPAVSVTLAQVLPVLMLTLLFETKLRPARERDLSTLAVIFGFVGNLTLALGALVTEFALLLSANANGAGENAEPLWVASAALFAVVVFRWAATSLATQVTLRPLSAGLASGLTEGMHFTVNSLTEGLNFTANAIIHGLISPAQILADAVETIASALLVVFADLGRTLRDVGSVFRSMIHASWRVATDLARAISQLFRR